MLSGLLKSLLAAACIVPCLAVPQTITPSWQPLTEEALDVALAPLPGVEFRRSPLAQGRTSRRTAQDRFAKKTRNQARLYAYDGVLSSPHLSATRRLGAAQRATLGGTGAGGRYENITATNAFGTQYGVDVTFGRQRLLLDLDTGSSDTWAFQAGTNCSTTTSSSSGGGGQQEQPSRRCGFGPRFRGNFTHGEIEGEHFHVEYGDGEAVEGPLGYMDVTVGGVRVRNQTVGLASDALWSGNNVSSGVLGLAYPGITSAFYGPVGHEEPYYAMEYSPVISTMVDQGLEDSFFSIAINRPAGNASSGVISFGGVPEDIDGVDYDTAAQADIIIANVANNLVGASDYSFYTIIPDGWYFGSSTDDKKFPYIVDSGTTLIYLPTALAQAINDMFRPPAVFSFIGGGFLTTCDAVAPRVAVVIDGKPFYLNPEDLLFRSMPDEFTGLCTTAFGDGEVGPFILGDVFLKNVLAVFDVGENVMQFASRVYY